jgi:hypothetical protein
VPSHCSQRLWAITSYFNPVGYRRRRGNYNIFRQRLGLPLLTVELAYATKPELGEGDADILVQLRGRDVMWQKERLLNIAVARLPPECDRIMWIDADVFVKDPRWPSEVDSLLDLVPLAQPFARVHHLAKSWLPSAPTRPAVEFSRVAASRAIACGVAPVESLDHDADRSRTRASGYVWAAHRKLVERHGLYDAAIIGGGDRLLAYASFGEAASAVQVYEMNMRRREHYLAWAERWQRDVAGLVGTLDCDIMTLWHGDIRNRGIGSRSAALVTYDYDPHCDIALDNQCVWRWASEKPELHAYLRNYFISRREDD